MLRGQPGSRSDQYSLALVYQELLTGTFPYEGKTPQQLMMHHIATKPDLGGLPPGDRPIVAPALAKKPDERFRVVPRRSCRRSWRCRTPPAPPNAGMDVRRARVERSMADMNMPMGEPIDEDEADGASSSTGPQFARRSDAEHHVAGWAATRRTDSASRTA